MPVSFDRLTIGSAYNRNQLATLWGYKDYHAIARGCVTPAGSPILIFFITRERQEWDTPYQNALDGDVLRMDGEDRKASDRRIVAAKHSGDEIHLFYRELHRAPFTYYGRIELIDHKEFADKPTQYRFKVPSAK
jgi:putative restriction endonuclease